MLRDDLGAPADESAARCAIGVHVANRLRSGGLEFGRAKGARYWQTPLLHWSEAQSESELSLALTG